MLFRKHKRYKTKNTLLRYAQKKKSRYARELMESLRENGVLRLCSLREPQCIAAQEALNEVKFNKSVQI